MTDTAQIFKTQYQPTVWFIEHSGLPGCLEMGLSFKIVERGSRHSPTDEKKMIFSHTFHQIERNDLLCWCFAKATHSNGLHRNMRYRKRDVWDGVRCLISLVGGGLQHGTLIEGSIWVLLHLHVYMLWDLKILLELHESHSVAAGCRIAAVAGEQINKWR